MNARRDKKLADELRLKLDLEEDEDEHRGYQDFLKQESSELKAKGFQEKVKHASSCFYVESNQLANIKILLP